MGGDDDNDDNNMVIVILMTRYLQWGMLVLLIIGIVLALKIIINNH